MKKLLIFVLIFIILFFMGCNLNNSDDKLENNLVINNKINNTIFCQKDAKICSDGSIVSRIAPNCSFEKCNINLGVNNSINKLKICPDEIFVNKMPQIIKKDQTPIILKYYILNGIKKNENDFDLNWVKNNCNVKTSIVY